MANEFAPQKAVKSRVKLKVGVQGPSGSGKTWGALALARNMWPESKICLIDTENESASLYADRWDFDTIPLRAPFTTDRYIQAIDAAIDGKYDVVIIDSITPQWDGEGGILRRKEELDRRPGANSYTNWATFTPEHEKFKQHLVQSPIHLICTMRSTQEYAMSEKDGKKKIEKLGMSPIQRAGFSYEFSIVFDLQMDHIATVDKDRTGLFDARTFSLSDPKVAKEIKNWLESGKVVQEPAPTPVKAETKPEPVATKQELVKEEPKGETLPPKKEYITNDQARGLSEIVKSKKVNTSDFSAFLKRIGYVKLEGVNPFLCIERCQLVAVQQWLFEHK